MRENRENRGLDGKWRESEMALIRAGDFTLIEFRLNDGYFGNGRNKTVMFYPSIRSP